MTNLLLVVGAIFILIMVVLVFRIQSLVSAMKGVEKEKSPARIDSANKWNALGMMAFLVIGTGLFIWYSVVASNDFLPEASSVHGKEIDQIFWITMAILIFVFILTHILLMYFSYRYQYKEGARAHFFPDNNRLEIIWTVIPAFVLSVLVFTGWKVWTDITTDAPEDRVELEIVGKQFNWIVRYPGNDNRLGRHDYTMIDATNQLGMDFSDKNNFDDFLPREIHIPVNKNVLFRIRSRDVLHSVFAPHFRLKMDAVPGMPTRFWFIPTKTTAEMREELGNPNFDYEIACTEICGRGHFSMKYIIKVVEEDAYEEWFASQNSFLSRNPEYLTQVPEELRPLAAQQISPEKVAEVLAQEEKANKETMSTVSNIAIK